MNLKHLITHSLLKSAELSAFVSNAFKTDFQRDEAPEVDVLEERIMLSASPIAVAAEPEMPPSSDQANVAADSTDANQNAARDVTSIVFIDSAVDDLEQLVEDFSQETLSGVEVVLLDSDRDGIEQISAVLSQFSGIESVHIVSHGSNGSVQLGATVLNSDTLSQYAGDIAKWNSALASDADLLIYGCDLAATEDGKELVDSISALTGSDVAASDDLTGHADLGGDWELEYVVGAIESEVVFSIDAQQNWYRTLETFTVTTQADVVDANDGVLSLREAVILANDNGRSDTILLGPGTYDLTIIGNSNSTGDLDVFSDIKIIGAADGSTTIDAIGLSDRIFEIQTDTITLRNVTLSNGTTPDITGGGALLVNSNAAAIAENVHFVDNVGSTGGAIQSFGNLMLVNSSLRRNIATVDGGGLALSSQTSTLQNVTISGNRTFGSGGGILVEDGTHTFTNTTISGNEANQPGESGGGIRQNGGTLNVANATITDNSSNAGSGLAVWAGNLNVANSIVSGNNLSSDLFLSTVANDVIDSNSIIDDETGLLLGALADNGGLVQTHELLAGSVGIDGSGTTGPIATDARGFFINDSNRDVGAFERSATPNLQQDLVAHFTFDEGTGSVIADSSVTENDGFAINGLFSDPPNWITDAAVGSHALDFGADAPGENSFIRASENPAYDFSTSDFSVTFWYNMTQPTETAYLVGNYDGQAGTGFHLSATPGGQISFYRSFGGVETFTTFRVPQDGQWHQLTATVERSEARLYVDGVEQPAVFGGSEAATAGPAGPLRIGASGRSDGDFEGQLDDVRIYSRALDATEATQLASELQSQNSNNAPVVDLNGPASGGNVALTFNEDAAPLSIAPDATVDDFAENDIVSLTVDGTGLKANNEALFIFDGFGFTTTISRSDTVTILGTDIDYSYDRVSETITFTNQAGPTIPIPTDALEVLIRSIRYQAIGDFLSDANIQFEFVAEDALGQTSTIVTSQLSVVAANDAPILAVLNNPSLNSITEDDVDNGGERIASLLIKVGNPISDVDGGVAEGIAIIANNENAGTWQYSIDNGVTWQDVGAVDPSNALLLRETDLLRLNPNGISGHSASLDFHAWDQTAGVVGTRADINATGTGGTSTFSDQTASFDIIVSDVNDAPVIDTAGTFLLTGLQEGDTNPVGDTVAQILASDGVDRISDVDSGAVQGIAVYNVDDTNGTWQYSLDGGGLWMGFGPVTAGSVTLLDPSAMIRFVPDLDFDGTARIFFHAWDQTQGTNGQTNFDMSGNGTGGTTAFSLLSEDFTVNISPINDAPVVDLDDDDSSGIAGTNYVTSFVAGDSPVAIVDGALVTDVDSTIQSLAVTLSSLPDGTREGLNYVTTGNIVAVYDAANGALTLTNDGTASNADFQQVLNTVEYFNTSLTPDQSVRTISVLASDGVLSSTVAVTIINVAGDSTGPTPANNVGITVDEGGQRNLNTLELAYTDNLQPSSSITYTITGGLNSGYLALAADTTTPITSFTQQQIDLGGLVYVHDGSEVTADSFEFTVSDGVGNAVSGERFDITVVPQNDAPEVVVPVGTQSVQEDGVLTFGVATGNAISISDIDAGGSVVQTTLISSNGRLDLSQTTGLMFVVGDGIANATMTFQGTVDDVNAALEGLTYRPDANFTGAGSLIVLINDLGNTGNGGNATDSETVNIDVASVNDPPITATASNTGNEDANPISLRFGGTDRDGSVTAIRVDSLPANGTLYLDVGLTTPVVVATDYPTTGGVVSFYFDPDADFAGTTTFEVTAKDDFGDYDPTPATATFVVNPVNDAPVLTGGAVNDLIVINEDSGFTTLGLAGLTHANGGGVDELSQTIRYNVTAVPSPTVGSIYLADQTTLVTTGTYTLAEIQGMVFAPAADQFGTSFFEFAVVDDGGTTNGGEDTVVYSMQIDVRPVNDAPLLPADTAVTVVENTSSVGVFSGSDPDGDALTYSLTGNDAGLFSINSATGEVAFTSAPDAEVPGDDNSDNVYEITIVATDNGTDMLSDSQSVTITVTDINDFDVSVPTDSDAAVNEVDENVAVGTTVGLTADAFDLDSTNNTVTYSLIANPDGLFQIDANTGVVTTAVVLDHEVHGATRTVVVEAASSDGSTATETFAIAIRDLNEHAVSVPTDSDATVNEVDENVAVGTTVGLTAEAFDLDSTNNTVTYSLIANPDGLFQIDANTGVVTTAVALDHEVHGATRTIVVEAASSDGSTATETFTIAIRDLNEHAVSVPTDSDAAVNEVDENVAVGTTVGLTADAFDLDSTNNTVTYSLIANPDGLFQIDANTGVVTTAAALDHEVHGATRTIVVEAASSDGSTATEVFTIAISDVNEFGVGAVSDANASLNAVDEHAAIGTRVGITASASDADATNNTVTYQLQDDDGGRFQIDSLTGEVTVAANIDFDTEGASRNITVRAESSDGSFTDQVFTIEINDVNEVPTVAITGVVFSVPESTDTTNGVLIADIVVTDDALGTNGLSLSGADADLFEIVGNELRLRPGSDLDFESTTQYDVSVEVDDTTLGTGADDIVSHVLTVSDVDDEAPVIDPGQNFSVTENSENGTFVGAVAATDVDTTIALSSWSIVGGNEGGNFAINPATGAIAVADNANLDFERSSSYDLFVVVSDGEQTSAPESVTISVLDGNDAPVSQNDTYFVDQFDEVAVFDLGVLQNDSDQDGDPLTAALVSGPEHGTLTLNPDGTVTYAAQASFIGSDFFTYRVSDGITSGNIATVEVVIAPIVGPGVPGGSDGPDTDGPDDSSTTTPNDPTPTTPANSDTDEPSETVSENEIVENANPAATPNSESSFETEVETETEAELELVDVLLSDTFSTDPSNQQLESRESLEARLKTLRNRGPAGSVGANYSGSLVARVPLTVTFSEHNAESSESSQEKLEKMISGTYAVTTASLSVGYVLWLIRGGSLLASFTSALPAWTSMDPLSIVAASENDGESEDGESLLEMVDGSSNE